MSRAPSGNVGDFSENRRIRPPCANHERMFHSMGRLFDDVLTGVAGSIVFLVFLFLGVPACVTALMAFDSRPYLGPLPPQGFSLQWFEHFLFDPYYTKGIKTSIAVSLAALCVSTVMGLSAAIFLNSKQFRGREIVTALFMSPLIVPPVVIGFALLIFLARLGVINGFVRLVCGHVILTFPYVLRATLAGLVGIDPSLVEVALNLGATETQAFREITLPLARTGIIAGIIFGLAVSLDDVSVSMFLTDATTYTLPVALVSQMRAAFDLTIAAVSIVLITFTALLIFVLDRLVGLDRVVGQGIYRS